MTYIKKQLMRKNLKYLISVLAVTLFAATAHAQDPVIIDEIIAKVDDKIVLKSDLEKRYLDALSNGMGNQEDLKCLILSGIVQEKLMVVRAEVDSVLVTDEEVNFDLNRRIDAILRQYNGDENMVLQYYGKTIEDIRIELRDQIKEQLVVQSMQQHLTTDLTVTPSEVRKFFRKIPVDSLPYYDMEVEIGQITKDVEAGEDQKEEIVAKLNALRKRIMNGESFEELAVEYSQGPSGPNGGDLGLVKRGEMVPEFDRIAYTLKDGVISGPVETQFGFHLIKMVERRGSEYHSRHILMRPEPSPDDIDKAKNFLDSLKTLIVKDSIKFEKIALTYSDDDLTKSTGGYFTDATGATRVSIRELDPDIYFAVDSLKEGDISDPTIYSQADGKMAARFVYFKSSKSPHQANLNDDWGKIQSAALMEKRNEMLTSWFHGIKDDVFILLDEDYQGCKIIN